MKKMQLVMGALLGAILCVVVLPFDTDHVSQAMAKERPIGLQYPAGQTSGLPSGMAGVTWELVAFQRAPQNIENTTGEGLTIQFDANGTLSGFGGCNAYNASYHLGAGQSITIDRLVSTLKACIRPVMNTETDYFGALGTITDYQFDGAHLQLNFGGGQGQLTYITNTQPTTPGMPTTGDLSSAESVATLAIALSFALIGAGYLLLRVSRRPSNNRDR
jgi:heat shock protein HslJ